MCHNQRSHVRTRLSLLVLLAARSAQAQCADPSTYVLPLEGSTVPPNPALYVFVPREKPSQDDRISFAQRQLRDLWVSSPDGAPLPFVLERIADDAIAVYRLTVQAAAGAQFTVLPLHTRPMTVARTPSASALKVELGPDQNYRWTCSYESVRALIPSLDAPAFRVRWAYDLAGVEQPSARTLILPGRDGFHYRTTKGREPPPLAIKLGHLSCAMHTLEWSRSIWVRVTALNTDGSEVTSPQALRLTPPPAEQALPAR